MNTTRIAAWLLAFASSLACAADGLVITRSPYPARQTWIGWRRQRKGSGASADGARSQSEDRDFRELAELAAALAEERDFSLAALYRLNYDEFNLAIDLLKDWRLDRYYAARIKLFDVVLNELPPQPQNVCLEQSHSMRLECAPKARCVAHSRKADTLGR